LRADGKKPALSVGFFIGLPEIPMCGRIGQFSAWQSYVDALQLFREHYPREAHAPRYNAGPGTRIATLFPDGTLKPVWWGYRPHWAAARKMQPMINARGDKITGATWKPMLKAHRVIVPADAWYEWIVAPDGKKQPLLLRAKDHAPLYFAALANVDSGKDTGPREEGGLVDGVVIVTDKSDAGMVDVHDRRPVALTAEDAMRWLDQETDVETAAEIARDAGRPVGEFEWFRVSRAVNSIKNDSADLIQPIDK
jgi:putative SOS response-associated peptidase YedK